MDDEPRPVRRLSEIDVRGVAEALDSHGGEWRWFYDPASGITDMGPGYGALVDVDEDWDPIGDGKVEIESLGSRRAYDDMEEFAAAVGERRAAERLQQALGGRGAFRRFRDAIREFDDLLPQWQAFSVAGAEMRAIRWLLEEGFVADDDATEQLAECAATQTAVLAAIGAAASISVELSSLAERLGDIEREIDLGHDVHLLRDGQRWATIVRD